MSSERSYFQPPEEFKKNALISSVEEYEQLYQHSIDNPESFWSELASSELVWEQTWKTVLHSEWDAIGSNKSPYLSWFKGGKLNVSFNCLDRHINNGLGEKIALIWEAEKKAEKKTLTYRELHRQVSRLSNLLKKLGIGQGSSVAIYLPMTPELIISVLACARLGAMHSVVFSAFSAEALKSRLQDGNSELVITADGGFYAGRITPTKDKLDQALLECPNVRNVLVFERAKNPINMLPGRDLWWHEEILKDDISDLCPAQAFDSENPLFILYTSGSTGKPKGVLHTSAGYLLYAHTTFKYIFDIKAEDIFWCTADVGWITGHSYLIYGPLSNAATCVIYEGAPIQPNPERSWEIIEDNKVSIFYTAPTAIRAFMKLGKELPGKYDLASLRLLGSVGEPINPEAWRWYFETIGRGRCPIVDTWWQTETGGIMITTLPGAMLMKPGSAGRPFFGVKPKILNDKGETLADGQDGILVIESPWPGMLRGVYGDPQNNLIKNTYFSMFPGRYFSGDGARKDKDGYYWLLGRVDDVINVSAHRFSTAELESALVSYSAVAEAAVVGFPHDLKGQGIYCFVTLKNGNLGDAAIASSLREQVRNEIGPIANPDVIKFCEALPKTRSGKIMRRILRKIAEGNIDQIGDTSTLADAAVVEAIIVAEVF